MFRIEVKDKESKQIIWVEKHETKEEAVKSVKFMKENTFSNDYFWYYLKEA
jgi:hypothetical protein